MTIKPLLKADAYANILNVLLSKRDNGVVTFNTWGMVDGKKGKHHDKHRFILIKTTTLSGIFSDCEIQF